MARKKRSNSKKRGEKQQNQRKPVPRKKEELRGLLDWFLGDKSIFSQVKPHGNTKWVPERLVCLALIWAWTETKGLVDSFDESKSFFVSVFQVVLLKTYQGFMKALERWTPELMEVLWPVLQERMEEIGGRHWRIGEWVPIAFDGSRSTTPRSVANERAFCAKNFGNGTTAKYRKKKTKGMRRRKNERNKPQPQAPQVWITMMWHMGLRLPWKWCLGPTDSSERSHVKEMIEAGNFPENTLFCGDAGFVGFPLWSAITQSGASFLVRVGGNVSLLREGSDCELRKKGLVLCWPKNYRSKQRPLRLRLAKLRVGKTKVWLLTNVLDETKLTRKQMIRFYKMRWGIEVEFRGLKQTLDGNKLRCRNDQRVLAELHWAIMAMAVAELFALKEQLASRDSTTNEQNAPSRRSLANTMRAIRGCIRRPDTIPEPDEDLATLLRLAITDNYQRKRPKRARYRPRNPDKKKLGDPEIKTMTANEKKQLRQLEEKLAA